MLVPLSTIGRAGLGIFGDDICLRNATHEDIGAIQAVDLDASRLFEPTGLIHDGPDGPQPVPAKFLGDGIKSGLVTVAVFEPENLIVGFTLARRVSPDLYLDQISVASAFGRRGIGALLLNEVIVTADRLRLRGTVLSTFRDLSWNGPFYRQHGFEEIRRDQMKQWMLQLEAIQSYTMDVSLRCFMRRPGKWDQHWFRMPGFEGKRDEKRVAANPDS